MKPTISEVSIIAEMRQEIQAHNNVFPDSYVNYLTTEEMLALTHPLYRDSYRERLRNTR